VLPDGTRVRSDRPVSALCTCRRSRRQPFCDTSHRRKVRQDEREDDSASHEPAPTR
jgi:CDGSH-type Zn-finger protein